MRKQTKEKETKETVKKSAGWISWTKACQEENEEVLKALVESGRIPSQTNPDLPPNHKIRYPLYLQVPGLIFRVLE